MLSSIINFIFSVKTTLDLIKATDKRNLSIISGNINKFFNEKEQELSSFSLLFSENYGNNNQLIVNYLNKFLVNNTGFSNFSYINMNGVQAFTYPNINSMNNKNIYSEFLSFPINSKTFNNIFKEGLPLISRIKTISDKNYGIAILVPLYDPQSLTPIGFLKGEIPLNFITKNIIDFQLHDSPSTAFIISNNGDILYSPTSRFIGTQYSQLPNNDIPMSFNNKTFSSMKNFIEGNGIYKSRFHETPKYNDINRFIYKLICYKPISVSGTPLFSLAITTPIEEISLWILSAFIEEILILIFGFLIFYINKRIKRKSLNQELEKTRVLAELTVANDIIQKEQMILAQKEQIEKQNNEILQQKVLVDRLYRDAIESNKTKTEFFSNATHELKTPVAVILSTVQLISLQLSKNNSEILDKGKHTKYLRIVRQNSYRIIKLINSLLQITKIDAGFVEVNLMNLDIVKITKEICFSVSEYIKHKDINFEFKTNIDKKIIAIDPDKIERILLNILANASKFTPAGGKIKATLSCKNNHVVISIKDSGVGIPKEKLDTIFDRFKQARTSQTRHFEGCGIGLSLVKSLVELHNGHIEVSSEVGKGTEFKVLFPDKTIIENRTEMSSQQTYQFCDDRIVESINVEFAEIYPLN